MTELLPRMATPTAWILLLASLMTAPALAVDGVLEIDQACVAAGCIPGDSPGFPVEIANSDSSYRLTSNLVVPDDDTTAISITASSVELDLNGFSILGQYTCTSGATCSGGSARAIDATDPFFRGVRIRGGAIRAFGGDAVRLPPFSVIEKVTLQFIHGTGIVAGVGAVVRDNLIATIGGDGIRLATTSGVAVDGLIEGNSVRDVGGDGIDAGPAALLLGNLVHNAAGEDARLSGSAAYGNNRFDSEPSDGTSMGNNVCGNFSC